MSGTDLAPAGEDTEVGTPRAVPQSEVLPLNSRRLVTPLVHQLAVAMGLPIDASPADVRQMIEGRLITDGREPRKVQVRISEADLGGQLLELQDAEGVFLEAFPLPVDPPNPDREEGESETELDRLEDVERLQEALQAAKEEREILRQTAENTKKRLSEVWRTNCGQLADFDATLACKDEEIRTLREKVADLEKQLCEAQTGTAPLILSAPVSVPRVVPPARTLPPSTARSGKAPPIDVYTGESYELLLDDWLPSLDRAAEWNAWSEDEKLLQLTGLLIG